MNSEKEVAGILGQAVVDGKRSMTEAALVISQGIDGSILQQSCRDYGPGMARQMFKIWYEATIGRMLP